MIAYFDYAVRDRPDHAERIYQISESAGIEISEELAKKIGQPFYEVMLACSLDTETGAVTVHGATAHSSVIEVTDTDELAALLPAAPLGDGKASTVGELIAVLSTMDPALPVMLARDGEGNGFESLSEVAESICDGETTWHTPEQWAVELTNPDSRCDPEEDAPPAEGEETGDGVARRVALLWP